MFAVLADFAAIGRCALLVPAVALLAFALVAVCFVCDPHFAALLCCSAFACSSEGGSSSALGVCFACCRLLLS